MPLNAGLRFSWNALTASRWSASHESPEHIARRIARSAAFQFRREPASDGSDCQRAFSTMRRAIAL